MRVAISPIVISFLISSAELSPSSSARSRTVTPELIVVACGSAGFGRHRLRLFEQRTTPTASTPSRRTLRGRSATLLAAGSLRVDDDAAALLAGARRLRRPGPQHRWTAAGCACRLRPGCCRALGGLGRLGSGLRPAAFGFRRLCGSGRLCLGLGGSGLCGGRLRLRQPSSAWPRPSLARGFGLRLCRGLFRRGLRLAGEAASTFFASASSTLEAAAFTSTPCSLQRGEQFLAGDAGFLGNFVNALLAHSASPSAASAC